MEVSPMTKDGYNLNEEITRIRGALFSFIDDTNKSFREFANNTNRTLKEFMESTNAALSNVANIGRDIEKIGGAMPLGIRAALDEAYDPAEASLSDSEFASHMGNLRVKNKQPLQRALACVSEVLKMHERSEGIDHRIDKLSERVRNQKSGSERSNAISMRATARDAKTTLNKRTVIELKELFNSVERELVGIEKIMKKLNECWPNGSTMLRDAMTGNKSKVIAASLESLYNKFAMGESGNRKTVKI